MYRTVATLLAIMLVIPIHTKKLPSQFIQCKKDDPNVDKCLAQAIEKALQVMKDGIPSHHVLPSDPLLITKLNIEEKGNKPVSISLIVTDAKLNGLKDTKIENIKSDLDKRDVFVEGFIKKLTLDGDYEIDGKFLVLPLKGKGKVFAQIDDIKAKVHITAGAKTKNGQPHWDIKVLDLEIPDIKKLTTKFENLFNGDETLAKPTQDSLNENWKELWASVKPAIEEVFSNVFKSAATSILDEVPEKDMFS